MSTHPHAELMAQYAGDARETDKPWERWEHKGFSTPWVTLRQHPGWHSDIEYRRKPHTININGYEVPEPLREAPEPCQSVYAVTVSPIEAVRSFKWSGLFSEPAYLKAGLLHLTREAAEAHAKALLSFTQQEITDD